MSLELVLGSYSGIESSPRVYEDRSRIHNDYKPLEIIKKILGTIGYTDKNIKEFEDWGTIYYKSAFNNIKRNSPLGWASRYLQKMWICVSKTVK